MSLGWLFSGPICVPCVDVSEFFLSSVHRWQVSHNKNLGTVHLPSEIVKCFKQEADFDASTLLIASHMCGSHKEWPPLPLRVCCVLLLIHWVESARTRSGYLLLIRVFLMLLLLSLLVSKYAEMQCSYQCHLMCQWVIRLEVEILVSMCQLPVDFCWLGYDAFLFHLISKLNWWLSCAKVGMERVDPIRRSAVQGSPTYLLQKGG